TANAVDIIRNYYRRIKVYDTTDIRYVQSPISDNSSHYNTYVSRFECINRINPGIQYLVRMNYKHMSGWKTAFRAAEYIICYHTGFTKYNNATKSFIILHEVGQ